MKVSDILSRKGPDVVTVRSSENVETLAKRFRLERIGAAVVCDDGTSICGIISERDLVHGFAEHGAQLPERQVSDLMTRGVVTCSPLDSIRDIMRTMTLKRLRHLPVEENGRLVGIVSIGDVVKHRLDEIELEANVLRDYATAAH